MTRPCLLIPLRSFSDGKRRLSGVLPGDARRDFNVAMLDHLLAEASQWPGIGHTVIVSTCPSVLARARAAGAGVVLQRPRPGPDDAHSEGLNAGLEQARARLDLRQRGLLVASCDLPQAMACDLQRLAGFDVDGPAATGGTGDRVVIATDRAGTGTNALYLPSGADLPFCFGPDSARRHGDAARRLGWPARIQHLPGLAFDIDTPADLAAWRAADTGLERLRAAA